MDNEKADDKPSETKPKPIQKVEAKAQASEKMTFLIWFVGAMNRFKEVQAHHMTTIRTYFRDIGLNDPETPETYDQGLIKFGFGRKK